MKEPSKAELTSELGLHPMHHYMRRFAENNKSVGNMAYRMLVREQKSWQTLRRYFEAVERFSEYMKVGKDADKALSLLRGNKRPLDVVDGFIDHLQKEKKLSPVSIKSLFYGVKKWLETNQVSLDWNLVSRPKVSTRIRDRVPTKDELRRIFTGTSLRDKALFLTCLSSGLRIGTAILLQIKDVEWLKEFEVAKINVQGGEGRKLAQGNWYFTFATKEAYGAVQDYLSSRSDAKPEDPLFAASNSEHGFYAYSNNVTRQWRKLCRRAGLLKKIDNHNWTELHTHVLRKFFQTSCKIAGISPSYYDFWMGHINMRAETSQDDSYFRAQLKQHVAEYKKALKELTIFQDIAADEKVQSLEKQVEDLTAAVQEKTENFEQVTQVLGFLEARVRQLEGSAGPGMPGPHQDPKKLFPGGFTKIERKSKKP